MQEALLHVLNFFLSELLPGNYGNYDVKVRVRSAKWRSQRLLTSAQFCSQYGFSNSVNDKSHEDSDTRTYYFHVKFKLLQQSGPQCKCKC